MNVVVLTVIKASVILAAAWLLIAVTGRARASVRHLVLAVALGAVLALPVAARLLPERSVPVLRAPVAIAEGMQHFVVTTEPGEAKLTGRSVTYAPAPRWRVLPLVLLLEGVWLLGAVVATLPLAAGVRELRRIRREGATFDVEGVDPRVAVLTHDGVSGPMTFGVLQPAIVFPSEAREWDPADVQRAMQHELEHVRRRDCLVDAVARVTCALYWFHPLAWLSWHRMRLEAERACDDAVLRESGAVEYAEQLVSLAARVTATPAPLLAMAGARDLTRRVQAVLDRSQHRGRAGGAVVGSACVAALCALGLVAPLSAGWRVEKAYFGQADTPLAVAFDVASIKENTSGDPGGSGDKLVMRIDPGGHLTVRNATLRNLVLLAYRTEVTRNQIGPLDGWMESRRFDIDARAEDGVVTRIDRESALLMDRMLRHLLEERFKLRVRLDSRTGDVYVLSAAPGGPRLTPAKTADLCLGADPPKLPSGLLACHVFPRMGRRGFEAVAVDTSDLASVLREVLNAPVTDAAKLPTLFDASVHWNRDTLSTAPRETLSSEPQPTEDDPDPATALREQLGLKLERQRGPVTTLIVEFAQPPTVN